MAPHLPNAPQNFTAIFWLFSLLAGAVWLIISGDGVRYGRVGQLGSPACDELSRGDLAEVGKTGERDKEDNGK
ncbi:MAG TPA: hypothetical protein VMX13_07570 [Sedimentisphaerales bacterium]|nr:hypothetical protein [Sedimentisphaerales bacterium]